ncbi:MAG: lytic transglycosylase domain-containing protein [Clostridia bacterium]|nr:lytic transglycosylase domain-containing protein [Clostridia bacterium]
MKKLFKFIVWVLVIALLIVGVNKAYSKIERQIYPLGYYQCVDKYCGEYDLDLSLVYAIIKCESGFDKDAVSSIGAKGLMQLTDETFEWVCSKYNEPYNSPSYLFDEVHNIQAGCRLLRLLYDDFGDTKTVLCAYHAGRNITYKWLENKEYSSDGKTLDKIPYADTESYVKKVLKTIEKYQKIYNIQ